MTSLTSFGSIFAETKNVYTFDDILQHKTLPLKKQFQLNAKSYISITQNNLWKVTGQT